MINGHSPTEFDSRKLNYWKGDFASIRKELGEIDSEVMFARKTVEEMWTYFKRTLQTLCFSHVSLPPRSMSSKIKKKTRMTKATK